MKFRLLSAHYLHRDDGLGVHLLGDKEMAGADPPANWRPKEGQDFDNRGEIVGDGTPYPVEWPTLEMEPLDDEAREAIEKEQQRIATNAGSVNPVEDLPLEQDWVPGFNVRRRPMKPTGSPVVEKAR